MLLGEDCGFRERLADIAMGLSINTNLSSVFASQQTQRTAGSLIEGLNKLATAKQINSAADNAAGLAIAERFRSQVTQANAEIGNLQTGVNVVQTADAALQTQSDAAQRLQELALQSSNGTLSADQRNAINQEAQQILGQIEQTAQNTEFNGTKLLNGSQATVPVGSGNQQVTLTSSTTSTLGINGVDLSTQAGAQNALSSISTARNQIDQNRANLGAQQNRFESAIQVQQTNPQNATQAESRIRDLDIARQTIEQSRNQLLLQTGLAALVQSNIQNQTVSHLLGG